MQEVGHTMDFLKRISSYISHIHKMKPTCDIVKHFLRAIQFGISKSWASYSLRPPKGKEVIKAKLKESEAYWQLGLNQLNH